eukprot:4222193-Pleurochrysis_carterae.AAC.2
MQVALEKARPDGRSVTANANNQVKVTALYIRYSVAQVAPNGSLSAISCFPKKENKLQILALRAETVFCDPCQALLHLRASAHAAAPAALALASRATPC